MSRPETDDHSAPGPKPRASAAPDPAARIGAIVTAPPYAPFLAEVARHPLVVGLRLNTVMPLLESPRDALRRLSGLGQPLWVDLKGRQLRVAAAAVPPFTEVTLTHPIRVRPGASAFFAAGREHARVAGADGCRLVLEDGPRRLVGPGESVNVVDESLEVEGTLTPLDRVYLDAMRELGLLRVLLSYVEREEDVAEVREILPGAEVVLKIESRRGLAFAARHGSGLGRLLVARGDLYVEVLRPHELLGATLAVLAADPGAIVGSRLFPSLARGAVPEAPDLGDAAWLLTVGFRTFLLGDEVCLRRESVLAALNLLEAVAGEVL